MKSRLPESLGGRAKAELEEEIRHHIDEKTEALVEAGWELESAQREARRAFGDVRRIRREMRRADRAKEEGVGGRALLRSTGSDLRYALRGIRKSPGFAAAVIATLGLGIGAASASFSVVDALLFRPMPYREAERLVDLRSNGLNTELADEWREASSAFSDAWIAWHRETIVRTDGDLAEPLSVLGVSPGADTLLGLELLHGRSFTPEDAIPGGSEVAILGRPYFDRLGADPAIVGRTIRLETGPATVVGVLNDRVKFPPFSDLPDVWLPLRTDHTVAGRSLDRIQGVWARLLPGLDVGSAQTRADQLAAQLADERPLEQGSWDLRLSPVGTFRQNPDVRRALWIVTATVGVIFLIALVNGVNLLLVRAGARTRELGVRRALGGSTSRILRQLVGEGLVLGALGGAAALLLAWGVLRGTAALLPSEVVYFAVHPVRVEARMLFFAFGASLAVGVTLGLVPGLQVMRTKRAFGGLAGRGSDDTAKGRRVRNGLVVAQVTLSMTLLAGAGLLVKSFAKLVSVDPGFEHERLALAMIGPSATRYPTAADRAAFIARLEEALEAHPSVTAVTAGGGAGFSFGEPLQAEGAAPAADQPGRIPHATVAPDYFEVMGIELVEGRAFEAMDAETEAAIVDQDLARFLWGDTRVVGRRFRIGDGPWHTVVGVVRELRLMGRDQRQGPYQILYPRMPDRVAGYVELGVRTDGDPAVLIPVIQETLRRVDPEQWVWQLRTAADALAEEEEKPRFLVTLMALLASLAVTLAALGLYGVLAYSVGRRNRELGVRVALGAQLGEVRQMVLREGMVVALVGVALGLGGALAVSRAVAHLLYEVEPTDPGTLLATALLLLLIAAGASFLPARRATRVDPLEVLKAE